MFLSFSATLKNEMKDLYTKLIFPNRKPRPRTALDDLTPPTPRIPFAQANCPKAHDNNDSDSSGDGTRFAKRTGIFEIDFPSISPKVKNKGKGKSSKAVNTAQTAKPVQDESVTSASTNDDTGLSAPSDVPLSEDSPTLFSSEQSAVELIPTVSSSDKQKRKMKKGKYNSNMFLSNISHFKMYIIHILTTLF